MAIHKIDIINPCDRPNCPGVPLPEFVSYPGTVSHLQPISVVWRILNNNTPTSTEVYYSFQRPSLNKKVSSVTQDGVYESGDLLYSTLPYVGDEGVLYMQARAVINGTIYFSNIETIIVKIGDVSCFPGWRVDPASPEDMVTDVYMEFTTFYVPDQIEILANFDPEDCEANINVLYDTGCTSTIFNTSTPETYPPSQFNPSSQLYPKGQALYLNKSGVWHDCFQVHKSDLPLGVRTSPNCKDTSNTAYSLKLLGPDFELLVNRSSVPNKIPDCIEVKDLTATIHYQTYTIRDSIVVYSGESPDPCLNPPDTTGLLWESGCVGTTLNEGPGNPGGNYGSNGRVDTFKYAETDVPFTVSVLPGCDPPGDGTKWCATVYYADGTVAWNDCGNETPVCYDIPPVVPETPNCILDNFNGTDGGSGVWSDGTYIYSSTYKPTTGNDTLSVSTFNGTSFYLINYLDIGNNSVSGIFGDGSYIYVCDSSGFLRAYDFNGSTLSLLQTLSLPGYSHSVWSDGAYIFIANVNNGIRAYTFDGVNFTFKDETTSVTGAQETFAVWSDGSYVYAADGGHGIRAYSFFGGETFALLDTVTDTVSAFEDYFGIWGDGTYIYTSQGDSGLRAYTFNGTTFDTGTSLARAEGNFYKIWVDGTDIYLTGSPGLIIYNFNGVSFTEVGFINEDFNNQVFGDGTYIYSANSHLGRTGGISALGINSLCLETTSEDSWTEVASIASPGYDIRSLVVFDNGGGETIYAGTRGTTAELYEWDGVSAWTTVASTGYFSGIFSMVVSDQAGGGNKLYAVTTESNVGKLLEWDGASAWVEKAPGPGDPFGFQTTIVHSGEIYTSNGDLYKWDGVSAWVLQASCLPPLPSESKHIMHCMASLGGSIYGGTWNNFDEPEIWKWSGGAWSRVAKTSGYAKLGFFDMVALNGKIYVSGSFGTGEGSASLFEFDGSTITEVADGLFKSNMPALTVYNGEIYGGLDERSELWKWNGISGVGGAWEKVVSAGTQNSIFALTVFDNKIYAGTGNNSKLYEWDPNA